MVRVFQGPINGPCCPHLCHLHWKRCNLMQKYVGPDHAFVSETKPMSLMNLPPEVFQSMLVVHFMETLLK